jgi:hypothetical protein
LKLGIIGLPNSGKTTIFNALTGQNIETTAYPEPLSEEAHVGMVSIPDARVDKLTEIYQPKKTTHADVLCADITGFARGISADKGKVALANLVWDADAIIHVVRAFADESVMHPDGEVDPVADAAALELEMVFNDLELAETRLERIASSMKKGVGKELELEQAVLEKCCAELEEERPLCNLELAGEDRAAIGSLQFLSLKPSLVVINVGEDEIGSEATRKVVSAVEDFYQGKNALVFTLSAKIEMELAGLDPEEAALFLEDLGIAEPARNRVLHQAYELLGLISFLTVGEDEVRAWSIRNGTPAVKAAGKVHSDIERGFIRAETVAYDDFIAAGSMAGVKEAGKSRLEGKDYIVADGDIINFRFNV